MGKMLAETHEIQILFCMLKGQDVFLPSDLLLNRLRIGFSEQVEHGAAEVVRVAVWVTQLIGYRIEEQVAA